MTLLDNLKLFLRLFLRLANKVNIFTSVYPTATSSNIKLNITWVEKKNIFRWSAWMFTPQNIAQNYISQFYNINELSMYWKFGRSNIQVGLPVKCRIFKWNVLPCIVFYEGDPKIPVSTRRILKMSISRRHVPTYLFSANGQSVGKLYTTAFSVNGIHPTSSEGILQRDLAHFRKQLPTRKPPIFMCRVEIMIQLMVGNYTWSWLEVQSMSWWLDTGNIGH